MLLCLLAGSYLVQLKAASLHHKDREGPCVQADHQTVYSPPGTHASESTYSTSGLEQARLDAAYVQSQWHAQQSLNMGI